ncbi:TIGR03086 family protein [Streptomyces sp. 2224.1]|uniref:TIGR03086 family metal-binding protein n=1 Tax=unclassified Streptomyces TaxID=2593676 RepID=UPI000896103E|nr:MULTISPECIES: TIGR03086 family metal-binding protein [unclassified Streptomyces]SEC12598.1 TIGR03086 family protein [Streptomyces sp. 2224.1]SEE82100.1 TIGR03086 family protein [Streptomyces sp. 2112.3]
MTDMQDIPDETPAKETGPAPAASPAPAPPPAPAPSPISALLEAAAHAALPVLRGVRDDQLALPTPCAEYDLRALLNHLFHVVVAFQTLAAKKDVDFSTTPDRLGEYGARWPDRFADETARLVEAWAAPGAEDGLTGGMNLPARTVGAMVLLDLTVHAWDAARATGLPYAPAAGCVAELRTLVARMAPTARKMNVFGDPFPVPSGASALDVLLAETGRDPYWTAG